ncbi:MAG: hypothetical protein O7G30_10940 [Proteobacteria bacterium]|nr:hypothetical protein [Pseudomonadota bacterium]
MKRSILAAAIATLAVCLGASSAQASDFRRGFEEQAGRILASHVAAVHYAVVEAHLPSHSVHFRWGVPFFRPVHHHYEGCGHGHDYGHRRSYGHHYGGHVYRDRSHHTGRASHHGGHRYRH